MRKSNSFTFDLIKSLNPSEKAYVKKQIKTSGKHLVKLFDDLNNFNSYNKDVFIKKNLKENYAINLSQNKNYLSKKIIEALIAYRSKTIPEIGIHNQINEVLILIEKKFYKRAKKTIDQCLQNALEIEDYATCYKLIGIILKVFDKQIYYSLLKNEVNEYISSRRFYLTQLNRIESLAELLDINQNISISKHLKAYKVKLDELKVINLIELPKDYPFAAKRIFYYSKGYVAKLSKNLEQYIFFNKKIIDLYFKNKKILTYHFSLFLGDALNFLNGLLQINDFKTFFDEHKRIIKVIEDNNNLYSIDNSTIHLINLLFPQTAHNISKQVIKTLKFAKNYIHFINENQKQLSDYFIAVSFIEISIAYLYNCKFNEALEKLDATLNLKNYQTQYYARLLQILAHYSLKNDLLLDHLFQSFINYLKSADKKEQIPNIRKFKKHVKNNTVHLLKNEDFEDFVYIHWDLFEQH